MQMALSSAGAPLHALPKVIPFPAIARHAELERPVVTECSPPPSASGHSQHTLPACLPECERVLGVQKPVATYRHRPATRSWSRGASDVPNQPSPPNHCTPCAGCAEPTQNKHIRYTSSRDVPQIRRWTLGSIPCQEYR
jgi:hypothetical protein